MSEQIQNARMQQKRDLTTKWQKAAGFIPKPGEIIVYGDTEKDKNETPTTPARIKIGDGKSFVSDLPGISGELYVQDQEPTEAGEGAIWIEPDKIDIDPDIGAVANWHSQEGEAGYIKNKPIEVIQARIGLSPNVEMSNGQYLTVSENYYGGMDIAFSNEQSRSASMEKIELILDGTENYFFIPQYFKSFIDLIGYFTSILNDEEIQAYDYAIAFCSAGSLGMSLTSLAILLIDIKAVIQEGVPVYEILAISNDVQVRLEDIMLPIGTHFFCGERTGIYITSFKFFYNFPRYTCGYEKYFKDGNAINVYSIGTTEDWYGIVYGGGGEASSEGIEIAKQALFSELQKYKKGDIILVPTILLTLLEKAGV